MPGSSHLIRIAGRLHRGFSPGYGWLISKQMIRTFSFLILGATLLTSFGREHEGSRTNSVLLNGQWEFVVGQGNELIPAGFGSGIPEVTDDVWIDFADRVYMKWVLAIPDLSNRVVKIRVTPTGVIRLDDLKIVAQVQSWPDGKFIGKGQSSARLRPDPNPLGGEHFFVEVPIPGFKPWTYCEGRTQVLLAFSFNHLA
jgi:hypothetical protein